MVPPDDSARGLAKPPNPDDSSSADRRAILARRAIFLSTALSAIGCSAEPGTGPARPGPSASASAGPNAGPITDRKSWDEVKKGAPPLDVSERLEPSEREELMELSTQVLPVYARLEQLWKDAPAYCPIDAATCTPKWRAAIAELAALEDALPVPHCGFKQGVGYVERRAAHRAFVLARVAELRADLSASAARGGQAELWQSLQPEPPPQPCLRCAPPPRRTLDQGFDQPLLVHFAEGSDAPMDKRELEAVKASLAAAPVDGKKAVLFVRGHAGKGEAGDPITLSYRRAAAVVAWLAAQGVPESSMRETHYGDTLPIAAPTAEGEAQNRRVDFAIEAH